MVSRPTVRDATHGYGGVGSMSYRVHVAPPGTLCDAAIHRERPMPAVVVTADEWAWCHIHWSAIAAERARNGLPVTYTPEARLRLGLGKQP